MALLKYLLNIILIAALGFGAFVGYKFAIPYYKYFKFKADAAYVVNFEGTDVADIRNRLVPKAEARGLMIPAEDYEIVRTPKGHFTMKVSWKDKVNILGKYTRDLTFTLEIEP